MSSTRVIRSRIRTAEAGRELLDYLTGRFTYRTRGEWLIRIEREELLLNGHHALPSERLTAGDVLEYRPTDLVEPECDLNYSILYEDEFIIAANKPGNLPTHPAGPYFNHTLSRLLSERFGEAFPVNRLDRETSGVILFARSAAAAAKFARALPRMKKTYWVLVHGSFPAEAFRAEGFLFNPPSGAVRKRRHFAREAPSGIKSECAATTFRLLRRGADIAWVEALPETGRMHQIRATLSSLGYPVVGDKLYGLDETLYLRMCDGALTCADRATLLLPRQALHAFALELLHPMTGAPLRIEAPAPEFFARLTAE